MPAALSRLATAFLARRRARRPRLALGYKPPGGERHLQGAQAGPPVVVDATTRCIYTWHREFAWSQAKRNANLKAHGLDFIDAPRVFEGATYTFEDDRFSYGEQRFVTLGLLAGVPVSIVHTETEHEIRIISFRKATNREAQIYFGEIQD
jgi:uncharacterized protein